MKLTYIFHSGFAIEAGEYNIIIDYYKDSAGKNKGVVYDDILRQDKRLYVLSSHSHLDHFNHAVFEWKELRPDIRYIFSSDIMEEGLAGAGDAFFMKKGDKYTDEYIAVEAFGSTDLGISFLIKCGGKTIFHAGDLNNWHWDEESTQDEIKEAGDAYITELNLLAEKVDYLDLAMFPVDPRLGENYMKGAMQFVEKIKTELFVPMHFREHFREANAFKPCAEKHGTRFFEITHEGDSITF